MTIEQKNPTRDSHGGEVSNWQDLATVWARVELMQGRDFLEAQQLQNEANARITMRYRSDVDATMQVVWGSHTFEIVAPPIEDPHQRELVLVCNEIT